MKKIGKIMTIAIILSIFCYQASFAAKLGEKNAAGVVVAIYNNKEYVAVGVTNSALEKGEVLAWSKWISEDLITIYNRCVRGNIRYWNEEYEPYKWYEKFKAEFTRRQEKKEIIAIGANSTLTAFDSEGNPQYEDDVEFRVAKDMTEEDKEKAEEYEKENYEPDQIVEYLEKHGYVCPSNCSEKWEQRMRNEIKKTKKDSQLYNKYVKAFEKAFGSYEISQADTEINKQDTSLGNLEDYAKKQSVPTKVQNLVGVILGVFQTIGSLASIICLIVLGIKYMMGSIEEKANYKKTLLPYTIGAIMVFGISNLLQVIYDIAMGF